MPMDRPSGEELHEGPETPPRLAASIIVLRDSPSGPEVLLVQRNPEASFMGGAWVFPGGAVNRDETPAEAAVRELAEEAGIGMATEPEALVTFSRWITPVEVKVRFDTWFYVAEAPEGVEAEADGAECVAAAWHRPGGALDAHRRGELSLVFPTIKHLEQLAGAESVAATIATARGREVVPVLPRIVARDGGTKVFLPGEPGYED